MSILFANGVSIDPMPGGGISAISLIQALMLSRADERRGAHVRMLGRVDSTNNQEASLSFLDQ